MGLVGEYGGVCGWAYGMNALAEDERVGGEDGSAGGRRCGRCAGSMKTGAFGDKLDKTGDVGTAVHGDGLAAAEGEW